RRARERYSCFDRFGEDEQVYGLMTSSGLTKSCEQEVVEQLRDLQRRATDPQGRGGRMAEDERFYAEQNARLVKNAESYYRSMFHKALAGRFFLLLGGQAPELREQRLERAIGVIYRPETERASHYFLTALSEQFDAVIHFDETRALEPLERTSEWDTGEVPDTFPFAV